MVGHATDNDGVAIQRADDGTDDAEQVRPPFGQQPRVPVFRGKDPVNNHSGKGLWHGSLGVCKGGVNFSTYGVQ